MAFDYQIRIGDYILTNDPVEGLPFVSGAIVNDSTSSANRLTIGGTVSNKLTFTINNPPVMDLDGQRVALYIREHLVVGTDPAEDVTLDIDDLETFLDDVEQITDSPNQDKGEDVGLIDIESLPGQEEDYSITEETFPGDNDEIVSNENYRDETFDIEGDPSPDDNPVSDFIEFGVYYITNVVRTGDASVQVTALDGFILMGEKWLPTNATGTIEALYSEFATALAEYGIQTSEAENFPDLVIHWKGVYSFRDSAGLFASLIGAYATFDRSGFLDLRQYRKNEIEIPGVFIEAATITADTSININSVACDISTSLVESNWITSGEDDTIEMKFSNPMMTQALLDEVLNLYLYTDYQPCKFTARYNIGYESGDFVQATLGTEPVWICITNQTIYLDSGLTLIESIGNSETLEANEQESPVDAKFNKLYAEMIQADYIDAKKVVTEALESGTAEIKTLVSENVDASQITTGEIDANIINVKNINGNEIRNGSVLAAALSQEAIQTLGGNKVFYQAEPPTGGNYVEGDTWYKTVIGDTDEDKKVLHIWDGSSWVASDFDARVLRANTITAQEIASNTIEANNINMDNLQTNLARVGATDEKHIEIDNNSVDIMDGSQTLAQFKTENIDSKAFTVIESTTDTDRGVRLTSSPTNANNVADAYIQTTSNNYNQGGADFGQGSFDALSRSNDNTTERTLLSRIFSDTSRFSTTLNLFTSWVQNAGSLIVSKHEAAIRMLSNSSKSQVLIDADEVKVNSKDLNLIGTRVAISGGSGSVTLTNSSTGTNLLSANRGVLNENLCFGNWQDMYGVSASHDVITIKQDGLYIVDAGWYFSSGFTANDILHGQIKLNGASGGYREAIYRTPIAAPYHQTSKSVIIPLKANDTLELRAYNQTAARGTMTVNGADYLHVTRII